MTLADSIVTIAQTLLRNRGQWAPIVPGTTPSAFVRAVADTASLLDISDSSIMAAAMVELRRRAPPYPNPNALYVMVMDVWSNCEFVGPFNSEADRLAYRNLYSRFTVLPMSKSEVDASIAEFGACPISAPRWED